MNEENAMTQKSTIALDRICQALFDSAAEGFVLIDHSGAIQLANKRMKSMFGYEAGELIGKTIELLVPERHRKEHPSHRDKFSQKPTQRSMGIGLDLSARRKDGSEFPVEISLNHFEAEGEHYVMALISDITRRKETEAELGRLNTELERRVHDRTRELRDTQNLYGVIARNFPNGTINVFNKDLNYVFAEGRELFRLGVTSEQLVGTNYLSRLEPSMREEMSDRLKQVFSGKHLSFEVVVSGKHYELNAVPLLDANGEVSQILVVETNITQQKKAEDNILKALEKERQLNELKSRFVSMASHEFRTPLSTILTSISLMTRYTQPEHEESRLKHINRIKSSVHNLTSILNDFLSLDKLETGLVSCNPETVNLPALLGDVVEEMLALKKAGQTISLGFDGPTEALVDKNMLRNVLVNLISNAIKYSPEQKTVNVDARVMDGKIRIDVKDQGIGIPEADKSHMFERFFRAHNSTNIQGTGLGLNIVKKYLDLMGGDIWFDSKVGEGSTFSIVLPQ